MGAGGKAINIFKFNKGDDPDQVINWRLWFAVFSFGIMGAARGIDEGLISGTFNQANFQELLGIDGLDKVALANIKGNESSMVQIGSVAGAGLAFLLADRLGHLWATRQLCAIWILGIVIFLTNGGRLGQVYAGRFIAGMGIGQTVVIAPVYISEVAPKSVRGLCTCVFSGSVYLGIMLAYFICTCQVFYCLVADFDIKALWGSSLHINPTTATSWVVPTTIHIMFASVILILSFFNYESPRFLIKKGKIENAFANLARIRQLPADGEYIISEIDEIQRQLAEEREATMGQGVMGYLREMFLMPNNFYRTYLGLGSQLLSQWSGAQSITIYTPDFFAFLGTKGQNEKLFATAIFGVVKFVAAILCALFLVDVVGRKRSLAIGITLQAVSMAYIAAFLSAVPQLADGESFTNSQQHAATGAIMMIYISGFGWAMGWNSMQYLLNAEIYPLRIRAISSSIVICFHFVNQYGNSRAVPSMLLDTSSGGLSPKGTFWFFTSITAHGGIWAWFFIPETAGRSLEGMHNLFKLKWWQIGRFGEGDAKGYDEQEKNERAEYMREEQAELEQVEVVDASKA